MADGMGEEREGVRLDKEALARAMQALTTEHAALEMAWAATIFAATRRATVFLSSVSSAMVALAFVGQRSGIETPFVVFGLVLFATLFFLGLVTFERAMQVGIADVTYARGGRSDPALLRGVDAGSGAESDRADVRRRGWCGTRYGVGVVVVAAVPGDGGSG